MAVKPGLTESKAGSAPGEMVDIPRLRFDLVRVDAYPSKLAGAIQHNALWDARALRHVLVGCPSGAGK